MNLKLLLTIVCFAFAVIQTQAQNLIVNPGAESPTSAGWNIVTQGSDCNGSSDWRVLGNQSGLPAAHRGDYFFYSGCGSVNGEINQVIDVSSYAADIDILNMNFEFDGFMQVKNEDPADGAFISVEFLDASNNLTNVYYSGIKSDKGAWQEYNTTLTAIPGTRKIRITLKSYSNNGSSVDAYFDDLSLIALKIVPLKLISFTTTVNRNQEVVAAWETANEVNTDYFELQRSQNSSVWQTVATVKNTGNSSGHDQNYTAVDKFPYAGQSYYRLVQYDQDGKATFSPINTVKVENEKAAIIAYPNPATERLILEGTPGLFSNLRIFNSQGQDVTRNIRLSQDNSSRVELNISELKSGVYFIKAGSKSASFLKK